MSLFAQHQTNRQKRSAFCSQTGNEDRSRSRTCSRSTSSTTSIVKNIKGTGDTMGIIDAATSEGGGIVTARGGWMLCLSGMVWPYPDGRFPVIWMWENGTDLHLHGGTCGPFFSCANLTSHQLWMKQAAICHTPLWPRILTCNLSLVRWQSPTIHKACINTWRKDHLLMA